MEKESFVGQLGGARPGAGRKKGQISLETKRKQAFEKLFIQAVNKDKKAIIEALMNKAKAGDVKALIDVLNRVIGKPIDRIDHTSKGEQMAFTVISYGEEDPINKVTQEEDDSSSVPVPSKETPSGVSE